VNVGGLTFRHWCRLEDYISALSFGGLGLHLEVDILEDFDYGALALD
jgi:hypothetical protein